MRLDDVYHDCTRLAPDVVRAELTALDTLSGAEVRRVYAAIGCVARRTVGDMRRVIRQAVLDRMGAYHRVHA